MISWNTVLAFCSGAWIVYWAAEHDANRMWSVFGGVFIGLSVLMAIVDMAIGRFRR